MAHTEDNSQEDLAEEQKKILVIEDDPSIMTSVTYLLKQNNIQVLTATVWTEAIDILEREAPDLMLLDLVMPSVDGINLLKFARDNGISIPVVVVSASVDKGVREEITKLGVAAFIAKPFRINVLVREIWRVLDPPFYQGTVEYREGDSVLLDALPEAQESSSGSGGGRRRRRRRRRRKKSKVEEWVEKWDRRFPHVNLPFLVLLAVLCLLLAAVLSTL